MSLTPDEAVAVLTDPSAPYLVGVRHHAPSLAAALPALLDGAEPDVLLVELPGEMQEWLPWLAHEDTRAPVALAAAPGDGGGGPAFYPFADFSPELAAVRWAARRSASGGEPGAPASTRRSHRSSPGRPVSRALSAAWSPGRGSPVGAVVRPASQARSASGRSQATTGTPHRAAQRTAASSGEKSAKG